MLSMPKVALRELRQIRKRLAGDGDFELLCAECFRQLEDYSTALKHYRNSLRHHSRRSEVHSGIAWCLKRLDDVPNALEAALEAYRLEPENSVLLYNVACYHSLMGNKSQTLSWLGRALRMDGMLRRLIRDETDFDAIRMDPDFQFIVETCGQQDE